MAGTVDDHSTDEFRSLKAEYAFVLSLTDDSEQWTEEVLRTYFSHGPADREGRERYKVFNIKVELASGRLGGRAIYNWRDPWFWYSDPEYGISCVFEYRHSSVRWSGPMVYPKALSDEDEENEKGEEVWEADPRFKAECRLIGIELHHEALLDFLRGAGRLQQPETAAEPAAEPTQPQPDPAPASAPREEPQPAQNTTLKSWVPRALVDHPPPRGTKDVAGHLMRFAPKPWKKHSIQNVLSGLKGKPKPKRS